MFDRHFSTASSKRSYTLYIMQPEGCFSKGQDGKVMRLRKALYGLRQAARAWNEALCKLVTMLGFVQSNNDESMYTLSESDGSQTIIIAYVDYMLIAWENAVRRHSSLTTTNCNFLS